VEVIDSRLKVLIIANSPHPDLAIFRNALLDQKNYEVEVRMAPEVNSSKLNEYDLGYPSTNFHHSKIPF
jgi:hypothetical protein